MVNRLHNAKSAFLREASEQPVDWREWSQTSLQEAKEKDLPILIDVGAVWCHWCHVMDRETYSNTEIAKIINDNFIPIKIDRDERPDLDRQLQNAVSAITGESGWPLTVFMTPSGKVFFGGTYFPPDDMYGRIGFRRLLMNIVQLWKSKRQEVEKSSFDPSSIAFKGETYETSALIDQIISEYDLEYGGLGSSSKFPHPLVDTLMLDYSAISGDDIGKKLGIFTLKRMYSGGILDQVGGGFHRYTVDREWKLPHFEKLLIDNAEILDAFFKYYLITKDQDIMDAMELTYSFVKREMSADSSFANSLDADSEGVEGLFYTWTEEEIDSCLGQDSQLGKKVFGFYEGADVEGRKVLMRGMDNEQLSKKLGNESPFPKLRELRGKLLECRKSRKPPFRDTNDYTHPNARMSESMIKVSFLLKDQYELPFDVLRKVGSSPFRRISGNEDPNLDDVSSLVLSNITAYEVTSRREFLDRARGLASTMAEMLKQTKPNTLDSPNESTASLVSKSLIKLSVLEGKEIKIDDIEVAGSPSFYAGIIGNRLSVESGNFAHVVVVDENDNASENLHREAFLTYYPLKVVEKVTDSERDYLPSYIRSMFDVKKGVSRVFICKGSTCSQPVTDPQSIKQILKTKI
ncbi:thioredoxin domain-containing protein [Sulfuracidifex tepidarius]|uniref:Spermatogenesis-associated protein 20-like TRX domain-containing protein n=1 Tax=Sulfuracidifex tepidarius TaxID=1294262 RepID=A0A510DZ57_9CREN|nr:thioredoxin domain-containing protein [Sulfuracidifex tepidarius]BBG22736.1 hypothetical protein IC006_0020 [Sulfuracidifex tepidarius]BBG25515.1 hypothetical protein IC007_0020 [Sulfuracidifex tepidarius]